MLRSSNLALDGQRRCRLSTPPPGFGDIRAGFSDIGLRGEMEGSAPRSSPFGTESRVVLAIHSPTHVFGLTGGSEACIGNVYRFSSKDTEEGSSGLRWTGLIAIELRAR